MPRFVCVTLDTEVDKDRHWRISRPVTFRSITHGIPHVLSPLFRKYGVKPTYLLSGEVMDDEESVAVLAKLRASGEAELGTHLHLEFVEPQRTRFPETMSGLVADAIQKQLAPEIERQKLTNLTASFERRFGAKPTSFRAGRFGMSGSTLPILADLGYLVDSSVTPGLYWDYKEGVLDYRHHERCPAWNTFGSRRILELPVSIRPRSKIAPNVRDLPNLPQLAMLKLVSRFTKYSWLRPSFSSGAEMIEFAQATNDAFMVMMLHSMEIIPKASPYAQTPSDVNRIVEAMERFFAYCMKAGIKFASLSEVAAYVPA